KPALVSRKTCIESPPALARITRPVDGRLSARASAWPHRGPVHWEHPERLRVAWMQNQWKANVSYLLRHVHADAVPYSGCPFHAVDAAVVLLIKNVRCNRMQANAVRIMAILGMRIGQKVGCASGIQGLPIRALVGTIEHAAARHADIEVPRIPRINVD